MEQRPSDRCGVGEDTNSEDDHDAGRQLRAYADLVAWPFADYVFGTDWDVMSDVTKARLYGFHEVVDSQAMFVRLLRQFREERIVP